MDQQNPKAGIIFTDGACSGNPGPGGWGAIIVNPENEVIELGGYEPLTTNNRMELLSIIRALEATPKGAHLFKVYTDSTYVIRGITQWIFRWKKNGWTSAEGKDIANADLWRHLSALAHERKLEWHYVRGHSGIPGNERVDQIAVSYSTRRESFLYKGTLSNYSVQINNIPTDTKLPDQKKSTTPAKPISYLSMINQVPMRHDNWKDCESRVKGQSGAKFKKAMSVDEEKEILKSWGFTQKDLKNSYKT